MVVGVRISNYVSSESRIEVGKTTKPAGKLNGLSVVENDAGKLP